MDPLTAQAARHARDIVRLAFKHDGSRKALVVFDARTPLSRIVTDAYRSALPRAAFVDFDAAGQAGTLRAIDALEAGDLIVLVQSSDFRLNEFRIRIELFRRGLAVIEHVHLERATDDAQVRTYVDALAYDRDRLLAAGRALKAALDAARIVTVRCAGTVLAYEGGMEDAKLNVGDYEGMTNVGGTFPIGEVFTEPRDLSRVHGEALLFAFAGADHLVQVHRPFKIRIEGGLITDHEGPAAFQQVLDRIGAEEKLLVREFGIGLNRAMSKDRVLKDITAFERQRGLHLSLGEKHNVYAKPGLSKSRTRFHVDVFVDVERIEADGCALDW